MSREGLMRSARGLAAPAALTSPGAGYRPSHSPMNLFLDIGTGAGLASSTGVRPYLPPLLAGGLARADTGIDFGVEVGAGTRQSRDLGGRAGRGPVELVAGAIGLALGALLFAGALADNA